MDKFHLGLLLLISIGLVSSQQQYFRLPGNHIPYHYELKILAWLDPELDFTFNGTVNIFFTCAQATDKIILHNLNLLVDEPNVVLIDSQGVQIDIVKHEYDDISDTDFEIIHLDQPLETGANYSLYIPYFGWMQDEREATIGMWYGSYVSSDTGEVEYYAATHFQTSNARALYPHFDEPEFKATFDITIGHHVMYSAFTNTEIKNSAPIEEVEGYRWDFYETTPVMSSYLVAMVIGNYTRVPTSDSRQFMLVRSEAVDLVVQSATYVPPIMEQLESKLNVPYPLSKLDHAGTQGFGGGMENYGLIIYADYAVADNGFAPLTLLTHETAHMWTGDLVTCKWWDVTWLNEGMTHFFTFYISDLVIESQDNMYDLSIVLMDGALSYDIHPDAVSMVVPIRVPLDIDQAFDEDLIYNRGGNIGKAMYNMLGETTFLKGMERYLKENSYQPVEEKDLFGALGQQALDDGLSLPEDFDTMMSQWTRQAGYPIITVTRHYDDEGTVTISQKRHLPVTGNEHSDSTRWTTPLTWTTASESDFENTATKEFLLQENESMDITINAPDDEWILFNIKRAGFYRVNYDAGNWKLIAEQLQQNPNVVGEINRGQILTDALDLCFYEVVDQETCMIIPNMLNNERSPRVWGTALRNFPKIIKLFSNMDEYVNFVQDIADRAEKRLMRTREAMTPERRETQELLTKFKQHLKSSRWAEPMFSSTETFWAAQHEMRRIQRKKQTEIRYGKK